MRMLTFSKRTTLEIIRDPINLFFGLMFPVIILLLLRTIGSHTPTELFTLASLAPGISVFGLSFMALFSATLVAKDRESAFLQRLYTTPLKNTDYILGYLLPLIVMSFLQCAVMYLVSLLLGLKWSVQILFCIVAIFPAAVFFVSIGMCCGCLFSVKQASGICGALLTNLTAWLSGVWFDLKLVGGWFQKIAECLPFVHAVKFQQAVLNGSIKNAMNDLYWVLGYTAAGLLMAVLLFTTHERAKS